MMRYTFFLVIIGVLLFTVGGCSREEAQITFNKDIAPIIFDKCTPCHRPGEAGPFPFTNYKEVRKKAKTIVKVTQSGLMPPWPADPDYVHYVGERFLTDHEKELIRNWMEEGAAEGKPEDLPALPKFPEGSQLGTPDLVVTMEHAVQIPGNNRDHFYVVKVPVELPADTFLRLVEYVPGNRQLSHHVNGHIIQYEDRNKADLFAGPRVIDREAAGSLDSCYRFLKLLNDDGSYPLLTSSVFNYLPGMLPQVFPGGIGGYPLKRKFVLLMRDLHYGPSPKNATDQPHFNLFFSKTPPDRPMMETQLGTLGISEIVPPLLIPPDTVMKFVTRAKIFNDISLLSINPHMHLLGQSFLAYALTAEGDTIRLVRINKWDFRWQYAYVFPKMVHIPAGSIIVAEGIFDNTNQNPNNPFSPPREISGLKGSMQTTDEMFQLIINFLPYQDGDENIRLDQQLNYSPNTTSGY